MKQLCPKCNGQKKVSIPPEIPGDIKEFTWGTTGPYDCQVCEGTGMVETKFPPQPQQKEQFSREFIEGMLEWIVDSPFHFDSTGWLVDKSKVTSIDIIDEYVNSKTKPI